MAVALKIVSKKGAYIERAKTIKTLAVWALLIPKMHHSIKHSPLFVVFLTVILGR